MAQRRTRARRALLPMVLSGKFPALRSPKSGTGFETSPPLAVSLNPFQFLKSLCLKSVGLGLASVPFHFGWDLVEWKPKLEVSRGDLGMKFDELVEISDEFEEDKPEVFGPQIELNLRTGSSIHNLGEPPVEDDGEVHVVEVIREETSEEGKIDVEMGTGNTPVHRAGGGDSFIEDYPGDAFEKGGEINLEKTSQTPSEPVFFIPSDETPTPTEPRKKRIKTLAGRTNLPWVWKMLAQQTQTTPSTHQPSTKQPSQPIRKSHLLAAQWFVRMSSSTKQGPPVIEKIVSLSEGLSLIHI